MNRIASITISLVIAVLSLAGAASAQNEGQKLTANIPFEFVVDKTTMPAGQYVFLRTGDHTMLLRDAQGHGLYTMVTSTVETDRSPASSNVRFANVGGSHVLVQVWSEHALAGSELYRAHALMQEARYPALHGISAGKR
jgi:hypothetical protein